MGRNSDKALKRRVRRSYVVSTVSIALVLFLMGTVGYLMSSVLRTAATMRESVTMIVELRDGLTEAQRDSIGRDTRRERDDGGRKVRVKR